MSQQLPLRPIDTDLVEKLQQTIDQRPAIDAVVTRLVEQGLRNVYFVGAGGSLICSYPAHHLLQRKASKVGEGLGVSTGRQAAEIAAYADGVIVGSAFVRVLLDAPDRTAGLEALAELTRDLADGVRRA